LTQTSFNIIGKVAAVEDLLVQNWIFLVAFSISLDALKTTLGMAWHDRECECAV